MSIDIHLINTSHQSASDVCPLPRKKFSLHSSADIFITSDELSLLRHCAERIKDKPNISLRIIATNRNKKIAFIVKTLIHLGVSCGQINEA